MVLTNEVESTAGMPSSKGKKHSKNQSRTFHSNVASSFSPGSIVASRFSDGFPLSSLADECARRFGVDSCGQLTNDAGNYFALAMIFPSSKITKNGVLLSSNLSNTMGCPPSGRVTFIHYVQNQSQAGLVCDTRKARCAKGVLLHDPPVRVFVKNSGESKENTQRIDLTETLHFNTLIKKSRLIMEGKGVGGRWRKWISCCLESTNFSIMIKGRPRVVDVLSRLLEKAQENNMIEGLKIRNEGVEISHRQFGHDTVFSLDAAEENWENLLELLNLFCKISGLSINKAKCSLLGINSNCEKISILTQSWVYLLWGTREPLNSGMLLWKRWNFASKLEKKLLIQAFLSSIQFITCPCSKF
ncbi:Cam interacting protein 111 [Prunus dulcis]|uniref:Cam interacting protein 111 n=1 Tax=Prunus dulcis TaxID=3755 RepID=A0A4Y1RRM0_PRUDU|nr:Cam interacting protein 111 [Prunus dulcis]